MENQEQNPSGTELEAKLEQLNRFNAAYPHTGGGIPL